jgi:peptide/nickel transport system permease protein
MAVIAQQVAEREQLAPAEASQLAQTWRRFRKHRLGVAGLVTLILLILSCIFIPILSPYPHDVPLTDFFRPASAEHWLGTDNVGRDVFTRLFVAGRISLSVGILTTLFIVIIGAAVGAVSGFYGGVVDMLLMRFVDLMLSIPELPILLILSKMFAESGIMEQAFGRDLGTVATIILVLTVFGWMGISRLVRGSVLSLRALDFIEATRALGASPRRIILRHLMPNSMAPLLVAATLAVGNVIIVESALSFLGLGIQPPTPSWGNMLSTAREEAAWFITSLNPTEEIRGYLVIFPGLMILLTVLSINFIGDALRDALDPRLKT